MKNGAPISEYDDEPLEVIRACLYAEIEGMRISLRRKPGWTAISYRDMFGEWPLDWMKTLTPRDPRDELVRWVRRRDAKFRREQKKKYAANGRGTAATGAAVAAKQGQAHRGNGYVEE